MKSFMKYIEQIKKSSSAIIASSMLLSLGIFSCFKPDVAYANNLRTLFQKNSAYIYTINIRTFGAQDYNNNDIIEPELGEVSGTFINAIPKLRLLKGIGVNTVYMLPITKVGKLHALGTAGSLYALDSFDTINPQFFDSTDLEPDIKKQAKKFVDAAHKLGMNVIVDLPACGSYDLSLAKPELFLKDNNGKTLVPADWTDIRIFNAYDKDRVGLNKNLINEHKKFIDLVKELGIDGIRADVAAIKPYAFWKEIIDYARKDDSGFLFIAEASFDWDNPTKGYTGYESIEKLLDAGFDGYYSQWGDLANIKTNAEFFKKLNRDIKCLEKYNGTKSIMSAIATHDQKSPMSMGYKYWQMVNWLNVLLPHNPYALDGFPAGDEYNYDFIGKTSKTSQTDNDSYSIKSGTFDIKNFSRAPYPPSPEYLIGEYNSAMKFRYMLSPVLSQIETTELKSDNPSVFAFKKQKNENVVLVIGNLDMNSSQKATIRVKDIPDESPVIPFKMINPLIMKNGKISAELEPYEIQVFYIKPALIK